MTVHVLHTYMYGINIPKIRGRLSLLAHNAILKFPKLISPIIPNRCTYYSPHILGVKGWHPINYKISRVDKFMIDTEVVNYKEYSIQQYK